VHEVHPAPDLDARLLGLPKLPQATRVLLIADHVPGSAHHQGRRANGRRFDEQRVFKEDILQCASCGGRRKVTAFIPSGPLAREILKKDWGGDATGPPIAKARARPHQEFDLPSEDTGVDPQYPD
jgi:hypothetical protein